VTSLVSAIVHAAHRRRSMVLAAVLAATLVSVEGIRRLSFDSNILSLLPTEGRVFDSFTTFVARFGNLDQLYVVFTAPDEHTIADYRDEVDQWVVALRAAPEIERVDAGVVDRSRDLGWLADRQLLLLQGGTLDEALSRLTREACARASRPAESFSPYLPRTWLPSSDRILLASSICCVPPSVACRPESASGRAWTAM
jgi:hypothetical protein